MHIGNTRDAQMYRSIVSWRRVPMTLATWELQLFLLHGFVRGLRQMAMAIQTPSQAAQNESK